MKRVFTIFFLLSFVAVSVMAQETIATAGGDISGASGSVSFTVGQIAVQTVSDGNHSIVEGVQQTYQVSVVGVDDYPDITLSATIYPNPTTNYLTLSLSDNYDLTGLECRIFDGNGKFLDRKMVTEFRTELDLTRYATGTYFVNLYRAKQLMKSFKVIKVRE